MKLGKIGINLSEFGLIGFLDLWIVKICLFLRSLEIDYWIPENPIILSSNKSSIGDLRPN